MRIQNNITAVNSHRMYTINSGALAKNVEKLSSGYRINRAGDDAAGLAISEKMRAQVRGLTMASKNSLDAISLIQTAEGALQSSHNILQRMRELAVQSASDTNETSIDRNALNLEFQQLSKEIDDIASKTVFNDQKLIDGTFSKNIITAGITSTHVKSIWVGGSMLNALARSSTLTLTVTSKLVQVALTHSTGKISATSQTISLSINGVGQVMTPTFTGQVANNGKVSGLITAVPSVGSNDLNGIWQLSFDSTSKMYIATNQSNGKVMTAAAVATTQNGAYTINFGNGISMKFTTAANMTINNVNDIAGLAGSFVISGSRSAQASVYANFATIGNETVELKEGATNVAFQHSSVSFQLSKAWVTVSNATKAGLTSTGKTGEIWTATIAVNRIENKDLVIQTGANQGDESRITIDKMDATSLGIKFASVSGRLEASAAITQVNNAINLISTQRATLGAMQNRLEFKISNLDTSAENLQAAESRIRDTDMAKEMTAFMKNNILFQASTAMLAQANSLPQGVLQLLG